MKKIIAAAAVASGIAGSSQAAVTYDFEEIGSDVIGILSGSLELPSPNDQSNSINNSTRSYIEPRIAFLLAFEEGQRFGPPYPLDGPDSFGPGDGTLSFIYEGDIFGTVFSDFRFLVIADDYTSGDSLSGRATFENATFESLGVTPGDYVYTLSNEDTVTLSFGTSPVAAVPLPASALLLGGALGAFGIARRRKAA